MNDQNFNNSYRPPEDDRPPVDVFEDNYGGDNYGGSYGSGSGAGGSHGGFDLRAALSSGLFLAICILSTVALVFGTFGFDAEYGVTTGSIDIFGILSTVGLWITYASACDRKGEINPAGATIVSGCIKAQRILIWVIIGLLGVLGILCIVVGALTQAMPGLAEGFDDYVDMYIHGVAPEYMEELVAALEELIANGFVMLLFVGIGICVLIAAIVLLIFNLTYYKSCHRLAYSVAEAVKGHSTALVGTRAVSIWLMVFGILAALSAAVDLSAALTAAKLIVCSVFVRQLGE